jgi:hypothetical protein
VEVYATKLQFFCAQITNLELNVDDKIYIFACGLKPKIHKRVVVDPFNGLLTYVIAVDATIEQICPKNMRKIPPYFNGPIRKDKARGKAITLSMAFLGHSP